MWLCTDLEGRYSLFSITGALAGANNFGELFSNPPGTLNYLTGPLTGTTGPSGGIGVSIDVTGGAPTLFVENRLGTDQQFTLSTMGK